MAAGYEVRNISCISKMTFEQQRTEDIQEQRKEGRKEGGESGMTVDRDGESGQRKGVDNHPIENEK